MTSSRLSLRDSALGFTLLGIVAYFSIRNPMFLSPGNLTQLMVEFSIAATLAIGMLLVILPGNIDLSAGSGVGLVGGITAVLVTWQNWPAPVAMLAGLIVALLLWWAMGSLIVIERVPAFIITLGGLLLFKGLFLKVIQNSTVPVVVGGQKNFFSALTTSYLPHAVGLGLVAVVVAVIAVTRMKARAQRLAHDLPVEDKEISILQIFLTAQVLVLFVILMNQKNGVPTPVLVLGTVALLVWILTQHTPWGRYLYAIGGNEEAAVISGIPVKRVTITAYVIMGAIVAITGFLQTANVGASTTTIGDLMELDAVAACVIGGVSLKGGRGTVLGVLFGSLIMACLINGMVLLEVQPEHKLMARGIVLILAVWMDVRLGRMAVKEAA
jgi:D-xylose transport system permease protein